MALSDAAIRSAKPAAKQFKLYDEGGLFLIVTPSGGKLWRTLTGSYPGVESSTRATSCSFSAGSMLQVL